LPRDWSETGAHECIRPTRPLDCNTLQQLIHERILQAEGFKRKHFAFYDLIFRRFMASECKPFQITVKKYNISYNGKQLQEERIVKAEGRAYELYKSIFIKIELPLGKLKTKAKIKKVSLTPPFYQSDIIQKMKEEGIGRPSTYATILNRLFLRRYVIEKKGRIFPTPLGIKIFSYLFSYYKNLVSEERTKILEEKMLAIENGKFNYLEALHELYKEIKSV